ncbi:MAG: hypothetical protein LBB75_09850 [Oscillospiraceae bacterium]|nr:hypothetical protein [Oscillospiraceae bacterium]
MTRIRERGKWLIALALCLSCFVWCAALMAAPTFAEEAAPKAYDPVSGYKNVYERMSAAGVSKSPKEFFYASGMAPAQVYNAELKAEAGKYTIGVDGYAAAPLTRAFPVKSNGTLDTAYPEGETPEPNTAHYMKVTDAIYEEVVLKDGSWAPSDPRKFVYSSSAAANTQRNLPAAMKGGKFYLRLANDIYVAVANDGTLDCNDVVKKLGAAGEEAMYPPPAPVYKYQAVEGYKNLYAMLGADGKPKSYIYSAKAPEEGKEPPAQSRQALVKGEAFYVPFAEDSGIFLAVNADGALNFGKALWWGFDGKFGTADDLATSVKEDSGYYYWQQAQGVWQMIRGIFNPDHTTTAPPTTSTTAAPAYRYRAVEGRGNLYETLNADGTSRSPRTYIYSETAPADGSAPPARARAAYVKGDYFYASIVEDSGIFLAVNSDGALNYSNAIWWGPDRRFGTGDDFDTSVREDAGQYFWRQVDGLWQLITGAGHPETTSTTVNPLLTTQDTLPPKTGKEGLNTGAAVCMALLLMACAYCGFQAFRRRAARTH